MRLPGFAIRGIAPAQEARAKGAFERPLHPWSSIHPPCSGGENTMHQDRFSGSRLPKKAFNALFFHFSQ